MQRSITFEPGEFYHIYNRGIDKRKIFFSAGDWTHFQRLMWVRNIENVHVRADRLKSFDEKLNASKSTYVDICAYALMDNHFHFLLKEKKEGGISKFMGKLLTSYSMYMNKKYDRSGPLMCRPFRAKHIDTDEYLRWVLTYIHLNPVGKLESDFEKAGIKHEKEAIKFLYEYKFTSYADYCIEERDASMILNQSVLPIETDLMCDMEYLFTTLKNNLMS